MSDLLITLIVTGALGGAISFAWQRRQWLFQQRFQRLSAAHEKQLQIVRDFFRLVHKRVFATRFYSDALLNGPVEDIAKEREAYRATVAEWSSESPGLLMQVRVQYAYAVAIDLEQTFQAPFAQLDAILRHMRLERQQGRKLPVALKKSVEDRLHLVNAEALELMAKMLRQADANKSVIEERPNISHSNFDVLGHIYLIKALLKPRQHF